jgi:2-dehydro-3-deoxygalactonokinase
LRVSDIFLAVDWGTTNRRAFLIENGAVVSTERDATGILAVPPGGFAAEIAALRVRYGAVPMILAGMVGSNRGWIDAGYVGCPAGLEALAAAAKTPIHGVHVIPGVSRVDDHRADVMRGEEVQLLGAVASGMAPHDALLCQPGTHCKWATMQDGAITDFVTAMTGELFALLKEHALIGSAMAGEVANDTVFAQGVADAADDDLLARLFGVRPASLLGLRNDPDAASYVSGLLIGSDCRARLRHGGREVFLLADPVLGGLYATAISANGGTAMLVDSHAAFVAGIVRLWELMR